ncbi:electron transport complex subunit RsxB [Thiothrix subterranea]|uniref:Ion-translocating oxidoreductase complex subunit B n=3 Tax=Thiothrix TaxID=1030 RepID=A0AA51R632_9GAMM|nr:electron transport complex subunit RsxB [Thiothrix subterranea]MDQ5770018.1 electron transport complex subunit RsxB [Thiothrix subterranea]WML88281.1 electron transport complex subunit RsxB [Thiothrix subterranea]
MTAILILMTLGLLLGGLLGLAGQYFKVEGNPLQEEIESLLPGSQCGQCGFPGCSPAAEAIANGAAPVTACPPGGKALAETLAAKLGVSVDLSGVADKGPMIAYVHENLCIGCTKCFKRCPTDAILGSSKQIHAVFADACTGCEKCFEVCPTECIEMRPLTHTVQTWYWPSPIMTGVAA